MKKKYVDIPGMRPITESLYEGSLTSPTLSTRFYRKITRFSGQSCEDAFKALKKALLEVVTLAYPDFSKPFIVDTDASDVGIGAVLSQLNNSNVEQPLAYYSRSLSKPERKYAVTRKEMLALVDSLRHFRCYLIGKKFKVRTDHSALQWLRTFKEPVGQVARWIERLAEYDFEIIHPPGPDICGLHEFSCMYHVCIMY